MKPFLSPFLFIGWVAVLFQIFFATQHNQDMTFLCMYIALICFLLSMIHSSIHYHNRRKKLLKDVIDLMDEIENKNKGKL